MNKDSKEKNFDKTRELKKFSLSEALAQQSQGMFKDASLVPILTQARLEIVNFIRQHLSDTDGCISYVLDRRLKTQENLLADHLPTPLVALQKIILSITSNDATLAEFVREVDQYYGENFGERPFFQTIGSPAHPDDPYTHESVRLLLGKLLADVELTLPKIP